MSETDALFKNKIKTTNYSSINNESNIIMATAQKIKHNEYHIHWRIHFYWTLAVICFILAKLWWLVPLPGPEVLPAYRTYPANFLNTIFLTFACALATRSIVVGLIKSFQEGIYPESIFKFGETGGFAAMWSCIKHRSGVRYFLIAMLVTACTLLGNALEGELQHSVQIYYKLGATTSLNTAQCQHSTQNDYVLASSAYSSGLITNTISDAYSLLNTLNASQPMKSFSVSVIKTALAPIQNITTTDLLKLSSSSSNMTTMASNTKVLRRHYDRTTPTVQPQQTQAINDPCLNDNNNETINSSSSSTINNNSNNDNTGHNNNGNNSSCDNNGIGDTSASDTKCNGDNNNSTITGTAFNNSTAATTNNTMAASSAMNTNATTINNSNSFNPNATNGMNNYNSFFNLSSVIASTSAAAFAASKLTILKSVDMNNQTIALLPYQTGQAYNTTNEIPIKLDVYRYTTSDNQEAVILYSSLADGIHAGVYVSATATMYTCQSRDDQVNNNVICDEGVTTDTVDTKLIADAMVAAIQSGDGLYGTSSGGLAMDIVNDQNPTLDNSKSKLVDALFANPLCSDPQLLPTQGHNLYPYSAGRMTTLAIIWLVLFLIMWLIGVYLIGYSEHTWTQLAASGNLVPQIISKSPNMLQDTELGAKTVEREMFLDLDEGRMNLDKVLQPGFNVSTTMLESE